MTARSLFIHLSKLYTESKCGEMANFLNRVPGSLGYMENRLNKAAFPGFVEKLKW